LAEQIQRGEWLTRCYRRRECRLTARCPVVKFPPEFVEWNNHCPCGARDPLPRQAEAYKVSAGEAGCARWARKVTPSRRLRGRRSAALESRERMGGGVYAIENTEALPGTVDGVQVVPLSVE